MPNPMSAVAALAKVYETHLAQETQAAVDRAVMLLKPVKAAKAPHRRIQRKAAIPRTSRPPRTKAPRKARKTTLAALKRKLWGLLREYVRATWGNTCFTCGAAGLSGINHHTGHFVNAGKSLAVRYSPDNVRPQCGRCNVWLRGNVALYAIALMDQIGEAKIRRLIRRSRVIKPLTAPDARELIEALQRGGADYELAWEERIGLSLDSEGA